MGMPMLFPLTYPEASAPMVVRAIPRRSRASDTIANTSMTEAAAIAETGSSAENRARTSAVASTENSRNGDSTVKVRRTSTGLASGPSTPVRAASQPRNTASAMTANPVRMSIMRAGPVLEGVARRSSPRPYLRPATVPRPSRGGRDAFAAGSGACRGPRLEAHDDERNGGSHGRRRRTTPRGGDARGDRAGDRAVRGIRAPRGRRHVVAGGQLPERRADLPDAEPASRGAVAARRHQAAPARPLGHLP